MPKIRDDEIEKEIKNLKEGAAPGLDKTDNSAIKKLAEVLV